MPNTLKKAERLHFDKVIGRMFLEPTGSFTVYPIRVVYLKDDNLDVPSCVLVSVSKRHFKHAVDRNRVKRQIHESYRLEKEDLLEALQTGGKKIAVAFIYLSSERVDSKAIRRSVSIALSRLRRMMLT